jgi:hypothetical protein
MKCPKCGMKMSDGYEDIFNYGLSKPYWYCPDWKKCKYKVSRDKLKPELKNT